ncbi:MAG: DUF370 domain-containing protein [Ruminococcaceae bacterium]|nr:DUF370 domain-containing protein [Oscillospiraceae bacterium]MBR3597177.1 DUF370 domain-containing protein [Clostridia bacterium]
MKLINIGFGNMVNSERIIAVVSPESAPVKRIIQNSKDSGKLIDVTQGRKTMSVIFTDSEHIILSYLRPEKLSDKFSGNETDVSEE